MRYRVVSAEAWAHLQPGGVLFLMLPQSGVQVTADFEFDVPVRFDSDQMDLTIETYQLGSWGQIPVLEIRP